MRRYLVLLVVVVYVLTLSSPANASSRERAACQAFQDAWDSLGVHDFDSYVRDVRRFGRLANRADNAAIKRGARLLRRSIAKQRNPDDWTGFGDYEDVEVDVYDAAIARVERSAEKDWNRGMAAAHKGCKRAGYEIDYD